MRLSNCAVEEHYNAWVVSAQWEAPLQSPCTASSWPPLSLQGSDLMVSAPGSSHRAFPKAGNTFMRFHGMHLLEQRHNPFK